MPYACLQTSLGFHFHDGTCNKAAGCTNLPRGKTRFLKILFNSGYCADSMRWMHLINLSRDVHYFHNLFFYVKIQKKAYNAPFRLWFVELPLSATQQFAQSETILEISVDYYRVRYHLMESKIHEHIVSLTDSSVTYLSVILLIIIRYMIKCAIPSQ